MSTLGDRIKELRGAHTQKWLAERLNIPATTLSNYENNKSELNFAIINALKTIFQFDTDWLLFGTGRMRQDEADSQEQNPAAFASTAGNNCLRADDSELLMVPMVEARLSAGSGSLETGEDTERRYAFRYDFLRRKGQPARMVLMRVTGGSMEPEIKDGDVVLIDQSQTAPMPGRVYAVGVEDMIYLKQVDAKPGLIILSSFNHAYQPFEVDAHGDFEHLVRIIGRVVWLGREFAR